MRGGPCAWEHWWSTARRSASLSATSQVTPAWFLDPAAGVEAARRSQTPGEGPAEQTATPSPYEGDLERGERQVGERSIVWARSRIGWFKQRAGEEGLLCEVSKEALRTRCLGVFVFVVRVVEVCCEIAPLFLSGKKSSSLLQARSGRRRKEAVVADLHETVRQDMQKKARQEFEWRELLLASASGGGCP